MGALDPKELSLALTELGLRAGPIEATAHPVKRSRWKPSLTFSQTNPSLMNPSLMGLPAGLHTKSLPAGLQLSDLSFLMLWLAWKISPRRLRAAGTAERVKMVAAHHGAQVRAHQEQVMGRKQLQLPPRRRFVQTACASNVL